jgi:hypothetical protein
MPTPFWIPVHTDNSLIHSGICKTGARFVTIECVRDLQRFGFKKKMYDVQSKNLFKTRSKYTHTKYGTWSPILTDKSV